VLDSDSAETLAARVLDAEHKIYPRALALIASGAIKVVDEKVVAAKPGLRLPLTIPELTS
jgi:phosphoribosylglycinamide formyltransferase-1